MRIEVRAHARLHFGFLDVTGERGRRFAGIGLTLESPRTVLEIEPADRLIVEGEHAERFVRLASMHQEASGRTPKARIRVLEAIPDHVGLGSGTQAALAVGTGLDRLQGVTRPPEELCGLMGRGGRSGIGFHAFRSGGLLVEAGHRPDRDTAEPAPLLLRHAFPREWRIVLAVPTTGRRISGSREEHAFARLRPEAIRDVDAVAGIVLLKMLPALVERDLRAFGAALTEMQDRVGAWFSSVQEGPYHPDSARLVRALRQEGATGVGQSSWGPTLYALAAGEREAGEIRDLIRRLDARAEVTIVRARNRGAEIATA